MNPKVFVSHASEDKDRFVLDFATKLRERGIDAWLDRWEMLPGDSLVDKIYEEGIKNAKAILVVISAKSVSKPWVREELNAGIVKRINEGSKLIPVVIDNCEIPAALRSTVWQRINDLTSYEAELDRIVMSIYGQTDKPPLGTAPRYAQSALKGLPGLTQTDAIVLAKACEQAIAQGHSYVETQSIVDAAAEFDIGQEALHESLEVLDAQGYCTLTRGQGRTPLLIRITTSGFENFLQTYVPDYHEFTMDVIARIVNEHMTQDGEIAESLNRPVKLVDHVLELLGDGKLIHLIRLNGGRLILHSSSPLLKRIIE